MLDCGNAQVAAGASESCRQKFIAKFSRRVTLSPSQNPHAQRRHPPHHREPFNDAK
jgi:hypothetical protein